jgi:hypothetical protein
MLLSRTSLAEAIDIPAWLEKDRQTSWEPRVQRDQKISKQADIPLQHASRQVRHWWGIAHIRCRVWCSNWWGFGFIWVR